MKKLFAHLNSLLPHHDEATSRENLSLPDQIDQTTKYIKKLQAQLERLKEKKSSLTLASSSSNQRSSESSSDCGLKSPKIEIHVAGDSALQVVLITGIDSQNIFTEAIRVIQDEGGEVVNASFSVMDDSTVFHTIHAKIEECSQHQVAIARITERLNRFCS